MSVSDIITYIYNFSAPKVLFGFKAAYFYVPAFAANMAPVLAAKFFPKYDKPIWESDLGKNKTWRGLVSAVLAAGLVFWAQKDLMLSRGGENLALFNYQVQSVIIMAFLFGGGAMVGDMIKSFIKRRIRKNHIFPSFSFVPPDDRKYPENTEWRPFDQIDFIIGSTMAVYLVFFPGWEVVCLILIGTALVTPVLNVIFYKAKLKKVPF